MQILKVNPDLEYGVQIWNIFGIWSISNSILENNEFSNSYIFKSWPIRFTFHYWLWRMVLMYFWNFNSESLVPSSNFQLVKGWDYSVIKWIGRTSHLNGWELEKSWKHSLEGDRMLFSVSWYSWAIMWGTEDEIAFESYRSNE